jgi:hypothetical protein
MSPSNQIQLQRDIMSMERNAAVTASSNDGKSHSEARPVALLAQTMVLAFGISFGIAFGMPVLPPDLHKALVTAPSLAPLSGTQLAGCAS